MVSPQYTAYPDINDIKLRRDIAKHETYCGYWNDSDAYIIDIIKKKINIIRNKVKRNLSFLDIGCGYGRIIKEVVEDGDFVILSDITEERIEEAQKSLIQKNIKVETIIGKFESEIKSPEWTEKRSVSEFDVIICSHLLQHLKKEAMDAIIDAFPSLLFKDGFLFVLVPISIGNIKNDYVVHGVEFNICIYKGLTERKRKQIISDYGHESLCNFFDFHDERTYICSKNKLNYITFMEKKGYTYVYKSLPNSGLQCSLDLSVFENRKNNYDEIYSKLKEYKLINNNNLSCQELLISSFYLICNNKSYIIDAGDEQFDVLDIFNIHKDYNDCINEKRLHNDFIKTLDSLGKTLNTSIENDQLNIWNIKSGDQIIAKLYKTTRHYCITKIEKNEKKIDLDIIEAELYRVFVIKENNIDILLIRLDDDWARVFRLEDQEHLLYEFEKIINEKSEHFDNIKVNKKCLKHDTLWVVRQAIENDKPRRIMGKYVIIKYNNKHFIYRDKKFNEIPQYLSLIHI